MDFIPQADALFLKGICHETQLLFDLLMSTLTPGKERKEKEWCNLFQEAGFSNYKIRSVLGFRSVIE
ncbi:hypothetical protein EJB05_12815, partial [Eragrostis curvula]